VRRSSRVILLLGILLAVGAFILIVFLNAGGREGATPTPAVAHIVVAAVDIPQGTSITASMLSSKDVPLADAPADSFALTESVVGKTARQSVASGAYVPTAAIEGPSGAAPVDVAGELKPGERAVAVQVTDPNLGVGFLIQSGDRVDLIIGLDHIPVGFTFPLTPGQKIVSDIPHAPLGNAGNTGYQEIPIALLPGSNGIDTTSAKLMIQNVRVVYAKVQPTPAAAAEGAQGTPAPGSGGLSAGPELIVLAVTAQQAEVINFVQAHTQALSPDYPGGLVTSVTFAIRSPQDAEASPDVTTGIILRTLLETYGVLPPRLLIVPDQGR
jgi:Flp pilus assembly protein CpaB